MSSLEIELGTIAHYQLEHLLARGGMSVVYLARDIQTDQQVAIKLVHASEHDYYERFQREANTLASLENEHILPIFDYGAYDSWFYMTMPYIEHGSLRDRLAKGPLSLQEAETLLIQLVDAVQYAHEHGILHRDIKPSNILLRDGKHVYLADFGLVKHIEEMSDLTQTNCMIGTPEYMAPELAEHPATASSDIYALGVVSYFMLTGHVPFKSNTPLGVYWKHLHEQPIAPSVYNQALPLSTDQVILRALAKDPERRYQSAKSFLEAYQESTKAEHTPTVSIVKLRPTTLPATVTRRSFVTPRKNRTFLQRAVNIRVGALLLVAVALLFIMPALLHLSLSYGDDRTQASILHASSLSFQNRIPTITPTIHPTLTESKTPTTPSTSRAGKTSITQGTNISPALSVNNTSKSVSQGNSGKQGSGKHIKHKHKKRGHGGKND